MSIDSGDPPRKSFEQTWKDRLRVPPWCPICGLPMKGAKSTSAYYDWGCCWLCHIEFVEDREERWKSGWRPSPEEIKAVHDKLYGDPDSK